MATPLLTHGNVVVNGVRLYYAAAGEGKPILLVHGNGETHELFETEVRQLVSAGYRVYAPDSRGHGGSEAVDEYHYADMAEDMYCLINALGMDRPAYYGFSDGGIIGLLLALNHPGCVRAMAISGTNLSPEGLIPGALEQFRREYEASADPLLWLMLTEPHIHPAALGAIDIPVLVTAGSDDLILPEETKTIAESLPDAECVIVAGADHGSYICNSPVMGNLLVDFLRRNGY